MMHKAWHSTEELPYCFSRSSIKFEGDMGRKIDDLNPILSKITRLVAANESLRFAWFQCNFQLILRIDILCISCVIGLRLVKQNPIDDKWTVV